MEYKYSENRNYQDLASGRVIYGEAGVPNFPVRLGNEIYRRCFSYKVKQESITLYDPCCGGGYLLTVLAFLNPSIKRVVGSDVDAKMLYMAEKNFTLLTATGLMKREKELVSLIAQFDKDSHKEALESLCRLHKNSRTADISYKVFQADCTKPMDKEIHPDIIITDVPYGNLVTWKGDGLDPIYRMYHEMAIISGEDTILAVVMDKKQKPDHTEWERLEKQIIGKRKFEIYRLKK